jgi:hypothetical protein
VAAAALTLAAGASAVLWLPALGERAAIQDVHVLSRGLDFRRNFMAAGDLVSLPGAAGFPRGYSLAAIALAVVALGGLRRLRPPLRDGTLAAASVAVAAAFMAHRASGQVWLLAEGTLREAQFPHRFMGPGALAVALLAGAGADALARWHGGRRRSAAALLVALGLLAPLTALRHVRHFPPLGDLDAQAAARAQRRSFLAGRGYHGELVPAAVVDFRRALRAAPAAGSRFDPTSLPPAARLLATDEAALRWTVEVDSPVAWDAVFRSFAFPGFVAHAGGRHLPLWARSADGLIVVAVPAGRWQLEVVWGSTPKRQWAGNISAFALLVIVVSAVGGRLLRSPRSR